MTPTQSVPKSAKIWCADETLRMAIEDIAAKKNIPTEQALFEFIQSPVYDALYDIDTGMWGEGPAMLQDDYEKCRIRGELKKNRTHAHSTLCVRYRRGHFRGGPAQYFQTLLPC